MKTINKLINLFETDFRLLPEKVIRDFEATEEVQKLRRDIKHKVPHANWTTIREELLKELQKLLDLKLQPIFVESWKSHQDVVREIDHQLEEQSNESALVSLTDHEIRSSHSPSLLVQIEDTTHPLRTFIGLSFNLSDVTLKIQHGEIQEIISGTANGSGFFQYQNATLIEQDFLNFSIADRIKNTRTRNSDNEEALTPEDLHSTDASDQESNKLDTDEPAEQAASSPVSLKTNMIQFIIGVSIALIAVFLFWQFK